MSNALGVAKFGCSLRVASPPKADVQLVLGLGCFISISLSTIFLRVALKHKSALVAIGIIHCLYADCATCSIKSEDLLLRIFTRGMS